MVGRVREHGQTLARVVALFAVAINKRGVVALFAVAMNKRGEVCVTLLGQPRQARLVMGARERRGKDTLLTTYQEEQRLLTTQENSRE